MKVQIQLVGCATALMVAFSGCNTTGLPEEGSGASVVVDIEDIDRNDGGVDVDETMVISDGNFSYKMGNKETREFAQLNPNATLNDLNDFAVAKCWNGYLKKKIENASPLTREDAVLLDFCMNVQLNMVDTLAVAALGDMTQPGLLHDFVVDMKEKSLEKSADNDIEKIYKEQTDVFVKLKANFITDNTGVRVPMKEWGNAYQSIPSEAIALVFNDIQKNSYAARTENGSRSWLWSGVYTGSTLLFGLAGAGIAGTFHAMSPDALNKVEEEAAKHAKRGVHEGLAWQSVENATSSYLPELLRMRALLSRARTMMEDPQSRKYLERIVAESENDKQMVSQYLDYALYDLPFVLQTYKARAKLKGCQGVWNDNEEEMMRVMADYNSAVSGTAMLKKIRTRYAANGYAELIKYFKKELSDAEFKDFVRETRLYNVDMRTGKDGRASNELSQIVK